MLKKFVDALFTAEFRSLLKDLLKVAVGVAVQALFDVVDKLGDVAASAPGV